MLRAGFCLLGLILCTLSPCLWAAVVIAEGSAPVRNGDLGQAREAAIRRALAWAAESQSVRVTANTTVRPAEVLDSIKLSATACARNTEILDERVADGELRVTLRVTVVDDAECLPTCKRGYVNRVVVAGFAMEYPEQKLANEDSWLANMTAVELSKAVEKQQRLYAAYEGSAFPYTSPARAPEPRLSPDRNEPMLSALARRYRGQYVVSGVYRDFGIRRTFWGSKTRRIEIEAFLHDGVNGAVLSRRRFSREATGSVVLSNKPIIGSSEFYAGDLGKTWGELLDEIAGWVNQQAECRPFLAHVVKADGHLIYLNAGSESGLAAGDTLIVRSLEGTDVVAPDGTRIRKDPVARASASIRDVYSQFSVAELVVAPKGFQVKAGDVLYER